jgi:hypothetical protein
MIHWNIKILTLVFLMAAFTAISVNAEDICRYKADPALSSMKTWSDLRVWFENYLICDDGYLGEGLSEFVTSTLAKQWNSINLLEGETSKNPKFKEFVLLHIDATSDADNLIVIQQNAEKKCPPKLDSFCKEIGKSVKIAINEMNEIE